MWSNEKPASRPDLNHSPLGYQPGATLGGQTWRGQLRGILPALLSTLPVRYWRVYTKGTACMRYLPKAIFHPKPVLNSFLAFHIVYRLISSNHITLRL